MGCGPQYVYHIYSPDKSQCITMINDKEQEIRYIIDGYHDTVPADNYVKLSLEKMDHIADQSVGCWKDGSYEWQMLNEQTIILENRLDTSRFKYSSNESDGQAQDTYQKYSHEYCFDVTFEHWSISDDSGAIVE